MSDAWSFETRQIPAGQSPDAESNARALPICQSTAFTFDKPLPERDQLRRVLHIRHVGEQDAKTVDGVTNDHAFMKHHGYNAVGSRSSLSSCPLTDT